MWTLRSRHGGKELSTKVGIISERERRRQKLTQSPYFGHLRRYNALIDTGATVSMISQRVIDDIGLRPSGSVALNSNSGVGLHLTYLFYMSFDANDYVPRWLANRPDIPADQSFAKIHVLNTPIMGAALKHGASFDVLLGMDVISTGTLEVNHTEFSFTYS